MHKFRHAPVSGHHFNINGRPESSLPPRDNSFSCKHAMRQCSREEIPRATARWVQLMASDSRQHRKSRPPDGNSASTPQTRSTSRISSNNQSCDRSASPRPREYQQRRETSPAVTSSSRQRAIAQLEEECSLVTYLGVVWTIPSNLEWNASLYRDSVLLFSEG